MNEYVTLRCFESQDSFYVNVISYDGRVVAYGEHSYKLDEVHPCENCL